LGLHGWLSGWRRGAGARPGERGLTGFFLMTLKVEITLTDGDGSQTLAHETAHVTNLTHAQTTLARRVAAKAVELLAAQAVLTVPLAEHLRD